MKVLYLGTNDLNLNDIEVALRDVGYDVRHENVDFSMMEYKSEYISKVQRIICETLCDVVITHDFSQIISDACQKEQVPYVSWIFDSPQKELYTKQAFNDCNYIYVFDRNEYNRLKTIGLNVYHTALAIAPNIVGRINDNVEYKNSISFVGQLYKDSNLEQIIANAPQAVNRLIEKRMNRHYMRWNGQPFYGEMSNVEARFWNGIQGEEIEQLHPYMDKSMFFDAAVLSRVIASKERIALLNRMAEIADTHMYSFMPAREYLSDKVIVHNGVGYAGQSSDVYSSSKINLNISLHCIETGACQRIFDVMGAGGFLISNYQKELSEMFVEDVEIVFFHNMEELVDKVTYYLEHEEQREKIARTGQKAVLEKYTYQRLLPSIIEEIVKEYHKNMMNPIRITSRVNCEENTKARYAYLIAQLHQIVYMIRVGEGMLALCKYYGLHDEISSFLEACQDEEFEECDILLSHLKYVNEIQNDFILFADVIENVIIPSMERWIQMHILDTIDIDERYRVEGTSAGWYTLFDKTQQKYLHSNNDPMHEAYLWRLHNVQRNCNQCFVYGCGLGYHIFQLHENGGNNVSIVVYEKNEKMVDYARKYGVLSWIPESSIKIEILSESDWNMRIRNIKEPQIVLSNLVD